MLKLNHLYENFALANQVLQLWKHDEDNLSEQFSFFRISSNAIYPFTASGEQFFLRLSPVEEKELNNILCETEFLQFLQENSFPANKMCPSRNGNLIETVDTEWGCYYACALARVEGKKADNIRFGEKQLFACGKLLAQFHNLSSRYNALHHCQSIDDDFAYIDNQLKNEKGKLVDNFTALKEKISSLSRTSDSYGICHCDFETDNLFYDKKKDKLSVIDFEDLRICYYSYDIAVALYDLLNDSNNFLSAEKVRKSFLNGYASVRQLPSNDEITLFYLLSLFKEYANLNYVLADENDAEEQAPESTQEQIEALADQNEELTEDDYDDFNGPEYDELEPTEEQLPAEPETPQWMKVLRYKLITRLYDLQEELGS